MSDRKYSQRGYLEDEREDRERRSGPRPRRQGPAGRGLGRPGSVRFRCARCGAAQGAAEVAPTTVCSGCGSDLHTCTNCRHFDPAAPLECRAGVAERISRKSKRNECELFAPRWVQEHDADGTEEDPKAAFDSLFDF